MSTPPSGGEGHNPYGQQPSKQPDPPADPYRLQPNPPYPYGQGATPASSGQSPYGEGQPAQPQQPSYGSPAPSYGGQPAQPAQPAYGSQPGSPSYGGQPAQPSYGDPAPPTQQFSAPTYGASPAAPQPSYGQPGYGQQPPYGQQQAPYGQQPQYGQPPYGGQPDWSGSPAGPVKKSKMPLIAGIVALVVLLAVVLLLVLPGSPIGLGKDIFDETQVAEDISQQYEDEFGLQIDVTCPAEQEVVSGGSFTCDGETEEGDSVELDVEITSDNGDYTWSEA